MYVHLCAYRHVLVSAFWCLRFGVMLSIIVMTCKSKQTNKHQQNANTCCAGRCVYVVICICTCICTYMHAYTNIYTYVHVHEYIQ